MIGSTLGIYLAKDFLRNVLFVFILFFCLIMVVDMVELSRSVSSAVNAGFGDMFLIALLRAPTFAENVLPFAALFGAATSLLLLNRRLELVVARASGVSVWQFMLPFILCAALIGGVASLAYNPVSLIAHASSKAIEAKVFGKVKGGFSNKSKNFWLRVGLVSQTDDGQSEGDVVIRARVSQNAGTELTAVSVYRFDAEGGNIERMDAASAEFLPKATTGAYLLKDVTVTVPGAKSTRKEEVLLPVNISQNRLQANQTDAATISFWRLDDQAGRAAQSGKSTLPYDTRFHSLLAQPLLFIAMVLVAATVSLTFARFGANSRVILGGIVAGFVLYVLTKLVITFGSNGLVSPSLAAWSPALVATLIGVTVLLHQEDG